VRSLPQDAAGLQQKQSANQPVFPSGLQVGEAGAFAAVWGLGKETLRARVREDKEAQGGFLRERSEGVFGAFTQGHYLICPAVFSLPQLLLEALEVCGGLQFGAAGGAKLTAVLGGAAREGVAQNHAVEYRPQAFRHKTRAVPRAPRLRRDSGAAGFFKGPVQRQTGAVAPEGNSATVGPAWAGSLPKDEGVDHARGWGKRGDGFSANALD